MEGAWDEDQFAEATLMRVGDNSSEMFNEILSPPLLP